MTDKTTIEVYDQKADEYIKLTATSRPDEDLLAFIAELPTGGRVLDLGCGPATASFHMKAEGLDPDPVDASQGMVDLANKTYAINARLGTFEDITAIEEYDGVWANFSLLHAPRVDLPRYIKALAKALKPNGVFHTGMKTGAGEKRDDIDRLYTYVTVSELHALIKDAGMTVTSTREGKGTGLSGSIDPFVICRATKNA